MLLRSRKGRIGEELRPSQVAFSHGPGGPAPRPRRPSPSPLETSFWGPDPDRPGPLSLSVWRGARVPVASSNDREESHPGASSSDHRQEGGSIPRGNLFRKRGGPPRPGPVPWRPRASRELERWRTVTPGSRHLRIIGRGGLVSLIRGTYSDQDRPTRQDRPTDTLDTGSGANGNRPRLDRKGKGVYREGSGGKTLSRAFMGLLPFSLSPGKNSRDHRFDLAGRCSCHPTTPKGYPLPSRVGIASRK
jgi:hypothetical protein